jgi:hypothetical protein
VTVLACGQRSVELRPFSYNHPPIPNFDAPRPSQMGPITAHYWLISASSPLLSGNTGWAPGCSALSSNDLVHSVTSTQGVARRGNVTGYLARNPVAERSGSALRRPCPCRAAWGTLQLWCVFLVGSLYRLSLQQRFVLCLQRLKPFVSGLSRLWQAGNV